MRLSSFQHWLSHPLAMIVMITGLFLYAIYGPFSDFFEPYPHVSYAFIFLLFYSVLQGIDLSHQYIAESNRLTRELMLSKLTLLTNHATPTTPIKAVTHQWSWHRFSWMAYATLALMLVDSSTLLQPWINIPGFFYWALPLLNIWFLILIFHSIQKAWKNHKKFVVDADTKLNALIHQLKLQHLADHIFIGYSHATRALVDQGRIADAIKLHQQEQKISRPQAKKAIRHLQMLQPGSQSVMVN